MNSDTVVDEMMPKMKGGNSKRGKMNTEEHISLFSIPLTKINIGRSFTKKEIGCFANIPMIYNKGRPSETYTQGIEQGSQSDCYDIFNNAKTSEGLKDIKTFCEIELKRYLEEIEGVDTNSVSLRITESWANKIVPQGSHYVHYHKNSYLSGVFYISCLPNDSIQFTNRSRSWRVCLPKRIETKYNTEEAWVNIKQGDFIIFPSFLLHGVSVNTTKDKTRMSLSFDTWPTQIPPL